MQLFPKGEPPKSGSPRSSLFRPEGGKVHCLHLANQVGIWGRGPYPYDLLSSGASACGSRGSCGQIDSATPPIARASTRERIEKGSSPGPSLSVEDNDQGLTRDGPGP
jgi:hypothetical protein